MLAVEIILGILLYLVVGVAIIAIVVRLWSYRDPDRFKLNSDWEQNEAILLFAAACILWPASLLGLAGWGIWILGERFFRHLFSRALSHDH